MLTHRRLDWDSEFFGFPVVRIETPTATADALGHTLESLARDSVRLVYWNCDPEHAAANSAAERTGGRLTDRKCTYVLILSQTGTLERPPAIERAKRGGDEPALVDLAVQSAEYSRFKVDPQMPPGRWRELYGIWIARSISGEMADATYIERVRESSVGLITVSSQEAEGQIGLLAVDARCRGRGVARRLLDAAAHHASSAGCERLSVVTQGDNAAACRLYERAGFVRRSVVHVYHFWIG